jgi:hypothetical protein
MCFNRNPADYKLNWDEPFFFLENFGAFLLYDICERALSIDDGTA